MPTATAQTTQPHVSTGAERLPAFACVLTWFATAGSIWAIIFALID